LLATTHVLLFRVLVSRSRSVELSCKPAIHATRFFASLMTFREGLQEALRKRHRADNTFKFLEKPKTTGKEGTKTKDETPPGSSYTPPSQVPPRPRRDKLPPERERESLQNVPEREVVNVGLVVLLLGRSCDRLGATIGCKPVAAVVLSPADLAVGEHGDEIDGVCAGEEEVSSEVLPRVQRRQSQVIVPSDWAEKSVNLHMPMMVFMAVR
jgi:hypothetical protein